jgi:hypothetical protein
MEWREEDGLRWLEAELAGARAAFTTRLGGASEPPFDGLNLGALTDDEPAAVAENRRRLAAALDLPPERIAFAHQVHGSDLLTHENPPLRCSFATDTAVKEQRKGGGVAPSADGHVVTAPGLAALVFVADCVPVALSGPTGAAMLHCGWRGLASRRLIERGVAATGATAAAVGPSIGPCCYEVGDEVLGAFADLDRVASGRMLDLPAVVCELLLRAGVDRIEVSGLCASCEVELFFSHRRDAGRTGRQAGLAWRTGGEA